MSRIDTYFENHTKSDLINIFNEYMVADKTLAPRDYYEHSAILKDVFSYYDSLSSGMFGIAISKLYQDLIYEMAMRYMDEPERMNE